jgi:hypothetical protein
MTIYVTLNLRHLGVDYAPGTYSLTPALEADMISRGLATRVPGAAAANAGLSALSPDATASGAAFNERLLNALLAAAGAINVNAGFGSYCCANTLFLESNTWLYLPPSFELLGSGSYRKTMFTTSNAAWYDDAAVIGGVAILCATDSGGIDGVGTVRCLTKTLYYKACGDKEGAGVAIAAGTGAQGTGTARYELVSGDGVRKLYVTASYTSLSDGTSQVRVHSSSGAKAVTWTRVAQTGNTDGYITVNEAAHGRKSGDAVGLFGTGLVGQAHIRTVIDANTYDIVDNTRAVQASPLPGAVFGRRNIIVTGPGRINYGITSAASTQNLRSISDAHAVLALCVSDFQWFAEIRNPKKYGIYAQVTEGFKCNFPFYAGKDIASPITSTAAFQLNGKNNNSVCTAWGRSTDTITALCLSDYPTQCFFLSSDWGGTNTFNTTIKDLVAEDGHLDVVRFAGAAGQKYINTKIINTYARVDATTQAIIEGIVDANLHNYGDSCFDGLFIKGLSADKTGDGTNQVRLVSLTAAGSNKSNNVVIEDVEVSFPCDQQYSPAISISGGTWGSVTVRGAYNRVGTKFQGYFFALGYDGAAVVDRITLEKNTLTFDNTIRAGRTTWPSNFFTDVTNANTVDTLIVQGNVITDTSPSGTKCEAVSHATGTKANVKVIGGNRFVGLNMGVRQAVSDPNCKYTITDLDMTSMSYVFTTDTGFSELRVGNITWDSGSIYRPFQINQTSGSASKIRSIGGLSAAPAAGHVVSIGSINPDCNGADLVCDTTKLAAVRGNQVRSLATGDVVMYNSGATWAAIA